MPELRTPTQLSPQQLCQELVREDPWRVLVVCVMLNQTSGIQVRQIFPRFFERWPTAEDLSEATQEEIADVIRPLGLYNRRAKTLIKLSDAWVRNDWVDITDLPGVGQYAADSYRIFVEGVVIQGAQDKELKKYCAWARSLEARDDVRTEGKAGGARDDYPGPRGVQRGGEAPAPEAPGPAPGGQAAPGQAGDQAGGL